MKTEEKWTEVISPKRSLFEINLKEVWIYRDLIMLFVRRDFVSQYKQTILGPLWLILQPLATTLIFVFVFSNIAKIPTESVNPVLFYLSGITLWNYFSDSFTKTSTTFLTNSAIFGKVYFPRLTSPISIVISNLFKLGIQIVLFLGVLAYQYFIMDVEIKPNVYLCVLPFLIVLMALMGLGLGIIFSALTTKYRDLSFLLTFGVQLLMYATPIIYPLSYTKGKLNTIISLNPLTPIMESFRFAFFSVGNFDFLGLIYSSVFTFLVLLIGIITFNQVEKNFMDTV